MCILTFSTKFARNISHYNKNSSCNEEYKNIRMHFILQSEPSYREFQNLPHHFERSLTT